MAGRSRLREKGRHQAAPAGMQTARRCGSLYRGDSLVGAHLGAVGHRQDALQHACIQEEGGSWAAGERAVAAAEHAPGTGRPWSQAPVTGRTRPPADLWVLGVCSLASPCHCAGYHIIDGTHMAAPGWLNCCLPRARSNDHSTLFSWLPLSSEISSTSSCECVDKRGVEGAALSAGIS